MTVLGYCQYEMLVQYAMANNPQSLLLDRFVDIRLSIHLKDS